MERGGECDGGVALFCFAHPFNDLHSPSMITQAESTKLKAEIHEEFNKSYFMVPRNALWAAVGGAIVMLGAVGVVSYKSALEGATKPVVAKAVETALASIRQSEVTAKAGVDAILKNVAIRRKIETDAIESHEANERDAIRNAPPRREPRDRP